MASADEYASWIVKNEALKGTPEFQTVAQAYQMAKAEKPDPSEGGLPLRPFGVDTGLTMPQGISRFAAGGGKAITDLGRGAAQLFGFGPTGAEVAETKRRDAPLMASGAGLAGNITGNLVPALATAAIPGVNTITGGAAVGAGLGALQPTETFGERVGNIGVGGVAGAAVPAAIRLAQVLQAAQEPLHNAGREAIIGRAMRRATGDDTAATLERLTEAGKPFIGPQQGVPKQLMGELVPGSIPTAAEAGGNAGLAAMQRSAFATEPTVTNSVAKRLADQNTARVSALRNMAGTSGARDAADTVRESVAGPLYAKARAEGVDPLVAKMLKPQIDNLMERMPAGVVEKAKELARINGETLGPEGSVNGLHWMKKAVDDMISGARETGIGTETKRALSTFQGDLLTVIDDLSPTYDRARRTYAQLSRPINQMDTAQLIADKSIRPLTDRMTGDALARALSDDTAKAATGFKGATLEGTMTPRQLQTLDAIKEDLARAQFAENAGRGAGSDTVQKLAYNNMLNAIGVKSLPDLLSRPVQAAEYVGRSLYGSADNEMRRKLAEALMNPETAARLMENAAPSARAALARALVGQTLTPLAIGAPGVVRSINQ